jgi:hypothetical protein
MRHAPEAVLQWRASICTRNPSHPKTLERGKVRRSEDTRKPVLKSGADTRDKASYDPGYSNGEVEGPRAGAR